ncbi:MAG: Unknown protein [uncultured Sulfurovum sp.]|uniref:Uncharacterized protein n=1 Tax=uncultured Sulfurovum sp. TaxID=269237 RepID=A0A6S6SQG1_9BACT|nr:MAG: Unknown protein [uncultured Sulfurovum sp.]
MTVKTLTALSIMMLTQPLMAIYSVDSTDCYTPTNVKAQTLNVSKFNNVWQELNKNNKASQAHLESYIQTALDDNTGTLDVAKFSSVWQKLNTDSSVGQAHLSKYVGTLLDNASKSQACTPAPLLCDASLDVAKFSTLWNEVKVKNNNAPHLSSALSSTLCSI